VDHFLLHCTVAYNLWNPLGPSGEGDGCHAWFWGIGW